MTGTVLRKPSAMSAPYWGMLRGLSKPVKMELVALLSDSLAFGDEDSSEPALTEAERKEGLMALAGSWAGMDDEMLDAALAKFSGDFGGSKDAREVARELRQGAEMVRDVETW